jgi:hypothetical protein
MRRTRLLCAIGVSLWAAVVAGNQVAPPVALSGALRVHVKDERFGIVTSIRGLPLGVRDGLQTLFGSQTLEIAEPGAEFQVTEVILNEAADPSAGRGGATVTASYYERGGIVTWQVALFHWARRPRLDSSGAVSRRAASRQSTTFGTPSSGAIKSADRFW